ncbi:uncharacterized protein LOC111121655 isoform X1 [Crassostrea virginica]
MARNEEKQLGRLNRYYLKRQHDEIKRKNPKRPRLETLNSVEDIKHWIPSLKKDIDFYLKQSQVSCYPERKIDEINEKISHLKKEYHAFIKKLGKLDPNMTDVPWTERSYQPCREEGNIPDGEHQQQISIDSSTAPVNFVPMKTPILDKDVSSEYSSSNNIQTVIPSLSDIEDEPLQFVKNQSVSVSNNSLNLPYSDSDDENEDDTCNDCRAACIEAPRRDKMQWDQGGGSTPVPP